MFVAISEAYLEIQRNGVIQYISKLTPEAQEQLENIEIRAGERAPRPVEHQLHHRKARKNSSRLRSAKTGTVLKLRKCGRRWTTPRTERSSTN
jgi:hypothetical protein